MRSLFVLSALVTVAPLAQADEDPRFSVQAAKNVVVQVCGRDRDVVVVSIGGREVSRVRLYGLTKYAGSLKADDIVIKAIGDDAAVIAFAYGRDHDLLYAIKVSDGKVIESKTRYEHPAESRVEIEVINDNLVCYRAAARDVHFELFGGAWKAR